MHGVEGNGPIGMYGYQGSSLTPTEQITSTLQAAVHQEPSQWSLIQNLVSQAYPNSMTISNDCDNVGNDIIQGLDPTTDLNSLIGHINQTPLSQSDLNAAIKSTIGLVLTSISNALKTAPDSYLFCKTAIPEIEALNFVPSIASGLPELNTLSNDILNAGSNPAAPLSPSDKAQILQDIEAIQNSNYSQSLS